MMKYLPQTVFICALLALMVWHSYRVDSLIGAL